MKKNLPMSVDEIVCMYRQSAAPQKQIGILADLCLCSKREIAEILAANGCEVPKYYKKNADQAPVNEIPETPQETAPAPTGHPCEGKNGGAEEDDDTILVKDVLPIMIRAAAIEVIAQQLVDYDDLRVDPSGTDAAPDFAEQVRGVLALVHEVERRCEDAD